VHLAKLITSRSNHISYRNGNPLDLRRENLKVTHAGHQNTSGYRGVSWTKRQGKWYARIGGYRRGQGTYKWLGSFDTAEAAARAYDAGAREAYGDLAELNFPLKPENV
jgi:hypothetical protein